MVGRLLGLFLTVSGPLVLTALGPATVWASPSVSPGWMHWMQGAGSGYVAAAAPPAAQDTIRRTLTGRVVSESTGTSIPYARVEVFAGGRYHLALADGDGRYVLRGVAPGPQRIRASAIDHRTLEVTLHVPRSGTLVLDLSLPLNPIALPGIAVAYDRHPIETPQPPDGDPVARGTPADPELRALEASPGAAELGLAEAVHTDARVDPLDPSNVLFVRGAASDLKLVLLDGAPVYAPFHLAGLLDAFHPDVLGSARLYVGGAPARYDGGLSYILDLDTRAARADRPSWDGAVDFVGARTRVEGPLPSGSLLASGRVLHRGAADELSGSALPYGYADGLVRLDLDLAERHTLTATGFYNRESVRLRRTPGPGAAYWGNTAGSVRYLGDVAGNETEIGVGLGSFTTRLPVGDSSIAFARGRSRRIRLTADLERSVGPVLFAYGGSYDRHRLEYRVSDLTSTGITRRLRRGAAEAVGLYASTTWRPAADVELRGGARFNGFLPSGELRLAPRVSAIWNVSRHSSLSIAAGRYHQYLRTNETLFSSDLTEAWTKFAGAETAPDGSAPARARVPLTVAGATHLVMGLDHEAREDLRLGLEAFYKTFDDAAGFTGLRASGADLWIDWTDGDWAAWAGYSLAWVWDEEPGRLDTGRFSSRQLLSAGARIPGPSGSRFDLRLSHSSGLPFTPIPTAGGSSGSSTPQSGELQLSAPPLPQTAPADPPVIGAPDGSYLRVDAKLSRTWRAELGGLSFDLTPYLQLLNALDRRDALFYQFDVERDLQPRSLEAVPLLPVLGIEWSL